MGTGKAVGMQCSIPSVRHLQNSKDMSQVLFPGSRSQLCKYVSAIQITRSLDTCKTVKICHRFYFLDQGHSCVNMFQRYKSLDFEKDARRYAISGCSEPPGIPAKAAMFVYIMIVLKNTFSNRQCYGVRQVN